MSYCRLHDMTGLQVWMGSSLDISLCWLTTSQSFQVGLCWTYHTAHEYLYVGREMPSLEVHAGLSEVERWNYRCHFGAWELRLKKGSVCVQICAHHMGSGVRSSLGMSTHITRHILKLFACTVQSYRLRGSCLNLCYTITCTETAQFPK